MKQVINIILKRDEIIENLRKEYLNDSENVEPHITLVYPFEIKNQSILKKHIKDSLKSFELFDISLKGLKKSFKEYYLYLLVDEGKEEIIRLYKMINQGILKDFKNPDMPEYIPHLTIGIFSSENQREKAIKEISKIKPFIKKRIDSIQLLTIDENGIMKSRKDFYFD